MVGDPAFKNHDILSEDGKGCPAASKTEGSPSGFNPGYTLPDFPALLLCLPIFWVKRKRCEWAADVGVVGGETAIYGGYCAELVVNCESDRAVRRVW